MRHRPRHRRKPPDDVQLNLAAMLDMAFQLLAFFILTFRPAPVEGQINLNLPPPVPIASPEAANVEPSDANVVAAAKTLIITIDASPNGQVSSVKVGFEELFRGPLDANKLRMLDKRLKAIFAIDAFEQVLLRVGKSLDYGELMRIVEICTKQKMSDGKPLNKISFVPLEEK
jgi:biopolymer transport protein ExbD